MILQMIFLDYTIQMINIIFAINLEDVAKWMNTNKSDLKETLLYSYKEKIDYKIIKVK